MHSIGHFILEKNPNCKVMYVTSEMFTNEVVQAIRSGSISATAELREKYRSADVLLVDDIQFLVGKENTQREFFNTLNELRIAGKQIVLSADKAPKDLGIYGENFYSFLVWGLIADMQIPDCKTKVEILRKKANNCDVEFEDSIMQYVATNIKSDIRELEGVFNRIIAKAKMTSTSKITLELVEDEILRLANDVISENYKEKDTWEKWKTVRKKISKIEKALYKAQKELGELEDVLEVFKGE